MPSCTSPRMAALRKKPPARVRLPQISWCFFRWKQVPLSDNRPVAFTPSPYICLPLSSSTALFYASHHPASLRLAPPPHFPCAVPFRNPFFCRIFFQPKKSRSDLRFGNEMRMRKSHLLVPELDRDHH
ncbi:hypothetical protein EJ06DRAFT_174176 [Trichodelitschia bisporula]|uniref:Uncharacterized protein n=1 Tax=Trichodelitschia bisporula TaxID=703511 RepID=A0A6G1HLZ5_9PEZI|nr:hypothetical protein EJ06DRAFT_174176 [Trichodelitschia bisporula]